MRINFHKLSGFLRRAKCGDTRGFTLTEIAIVLAIFGIIIAGAFIMISSAMKIQQTNRVFQQVISILENTRNYTSRVDNNTINLTSIKDFDNLGLLPADVTTSDGTTYLDALGSPIDACAAGNANDVGSCPAATGSNMGGQGIMIVVENLYTDECVNLASKFGNAQANPGLIRAAVGGNDIINAGTPGTIASYSANCTGFNYVPGGHVARLYLLFKF